MNVRNGWKPDFARAILDSVTGERQKGGMCSLSLAHDELIERQAFQLRLMDQLRALATPIDIMSTAAKALGEFLGADRCGYGEIVTGGTTVRVEQDWAKPSALSLAGEARLLEAFGPAVIAELRAGRTLVVHDCREDPRSNAPEFLKTWESIDTRALIVCPLLRADEFAAILYLHEAQPRRWTAKEVSLVEDVALRTRDAVDRARAEAALRDGEERMRLALEAGGFWDWYWDAATDRIRFSSRTSRSLNIPATHEPTSADIATGVHEDDLVRVIEAGKRALATGEKYNIEYRMRRPDGSTTWVSTYGQPVRAAGGEVSGVIGISQDITARKLADEALREREQQLSAFINQTTAGFAQVDLDGRFTLVNDRFCEIAGRTREELLSLRMLEITHPDHLETNVSLFERAVAEGTPYTHEKRYIRGDGSTIWVNNSVAVIRKASGEPYGVLAVTLDITERKRAEESQRLLINELNHRVKNTLAIVQAVAHQSLNADAVPTEAREAFEKRIAALSAAHNLLTDRNWEGASIQQVMLEGLAPYREADRITLEGPDIPLTPKAAVSLAMAVHELATNAVKYGALANDAGRVQITWSAENDRLQLKWAEVGGPPVSPPSRRGFGSRMLERGLAGEFGGEVKIEFHREGVTCRLSAPLPPQG